MPRTLPIALLSLSLAIPAAARAEGIALRYDVYAGGTFAVAMEAEVQIAPTAYQLGAALELGGMYALVHDWDLQATVTGAIAGDALLPIRFAKQQEGGERWAELDFAGGTLASARGNPPPESEDNSAVPDALKAAAVDPLTAIVDVLRQVAVTGACAGETIVYDGKEYFSISRVDLGRADAPQSRYGAYAGPALLCRITVDDDAPYGEVADDARTAEIWLAQPIAGSLYVPVRIETETKYGAVRVHLTDFWSVSGETAGVQ